MAKKAPKEQLGTQMIKELSDELKYVKSELEEHEALWFDLQSKL